MATGRVIEWRSVDGTMWHLFIGPKSICNRSYSNGEFDSADVPPKGDKVCGWCKRRCIEVRERIVEVTDFVSTEHKKRSQKA